DVELAPDVLVDATVIAQIEPCIHRFLMNERRERLERLPRPLPIEAEHGGHALGRRSFARELREGAPEAAPRGVERPLELPLGGGDVELDAELDEGDGIRALGRLEIRAAREQLL